MEIIDKDNNNIIEDCNNKENRLEDNTINEENLDFDIPDDDDDDYDRVYGYEAGLSEEAALCGYNPYEYQLDIQSALTGGDDKSPNGIILSATAGIISQYIDSHGEYNLAYIWHDGSTISAQWMAFANSQLEILNSVRSKSMKFPYFKTPPASATAYLLVATKDFRANTDVYGRKNGILMRQRSGKDIGTWTLQQDNSMLDRFINRLYVDASKFYRNEVKADILIQLETYENEPDNTIIMLDNGVYNCKTGEFLSYTDSAYDSQYGHIVSQSKLYGVQWTHKTSAELEKDCTIYNPDDNTTWSPIQGLIDLVGDGVALQALREIMHFALRRMSGGFAWWFLNTTGNAAGGGGKSTALQIVKNITGGERNALCVPYDHLGDRFALTDLDKKYCIVSDETEGANRRPADTSVYKSLITNGTVTIDVKNEKAYQLKWQGMMIQAINGIPMFSDNSDSTYRRLLALPWEKRLTKNGRKRDYIRDDYINRPEVIQCYMKWALELGCMTTYSHEVIDYCLPYVEMMKNEAKTVYGFMPELIRRIADEHYFAGMNEVGRSFLYALYRKWDEEENCARNHISQKKFWTSVCEWVQSHPECGWEVTDGITHIYPKTPRQQELKDYDLGSAWCEYGPLRTPNGFFPFKTTKTIRCGLLRVNKFPKNLSGIPHSDDDTTAENSNK